MSDQFIGFLTDPPTTVAPASHQLIGERIHTHIDFNRCLVDVPSGLTRCSLGAIGVSPRCDKGTIPAIARNTVLVPTATSRQAVSAISGSTRCDIGPIAEPSRCLVRTPSNLSRATVTAIDPVACTHPPLVVTDTCRTSGTVSSSFRRQETGATGSNRRCPVETTV